MTKVIEKAFIVLKPDEDGIKVFMLSFFVEQRLLRIEAR